MAKNILDYYSVNNYLSDPSYSSDAVRPYQINSYLPKSSGVSNSSVYQINPSDISRLINAEYKPKLTWWKKLLSSKPVTGAINTLQGIGSIIPNQLYNWTDGNVDWKDIPLADYSIDAMKDFKANDPLNWLEQTVGLGFLRSAGKRAKTSEDVIANLGYTQGEATGKKKGLFNGFFTPEKDNFDIFDIGMFALDTALDPTTYLLGAGVAGNASKSGLSAAKNSVKTIAKTYGVEAKISKDVLKMANETSTAVRNKHFDDLVRNQGVDVTEAARRADNLQVEIADMIEKSAAEARGKFNDALLSLNIPLTDIAIPLGKAPSLLRKTSAKIDNIGKNALNLAFKGVKNPIYFINKLPGLEKVKNLKDLNVQQFKFITERLTDLNLQTVKEIEQKLATAIPDNPNLIKQASVLLTSTMNQAAVDTKDILRQFDEIDVPIPDEVAAKVAPQFVKAFDDVFGSQFNVNSLVQKSDLTTASGLEAFRQKLIKKMQAPLSQKMAQKEIAEQINTIFDDVTKQDFLPYTKPKTDMIAIVKSSLKNRQQLFKQIAESGKSSEPMARISEQLQNLTDNLKLKRFVEDVGGKSKLGEWLSDRLFKWFNPRTFGITGDESAGYLNTLANFVQDAKNRQRGLHRQLADELDRVQNLAKKLKISTNDLSKIPYLIENVYPNGVDKATFLDSLKDAASTQTLAFELSEILTRLGGREVMAGALRRWRTNYFPIVTKGTAVNENDALRLMFKEPIGQRLFGKSAYNKFNNKRTVFQNYAELDDAIQKARRGIEKITDPEEAQKASDLLQKVENSFERNIFEIMKQRYKTSVRSTIMSQAYRELEQAGGIFRKLNVKNSVDAENLKKLGYMLVEDDSLPKATGGALQIGDYVQKGIVEGLEATDALFTDKNVQSIVDAYTSSLNIFKSLATTYRLAHHYINLMGNVMNNSMAGVGTESYKKMAELSFRMKSKNGKNLTTADKELLQKMYDDGILTGDSSFELHDVFREARINEDDGRHWILKGFNKAENAITNNLYARTMRAVGREIDIISRGAHYIDKLQKTGSQELAKESVRKYLYNYNELTNTDSAIKLIVPFWTFTKNNLPRMFLEFLNQPRYFTAYERIREDMSNEETLIPDYLDKALGAFQIGDSSFYNPRLPMGMLGELEASPLEFGVNSLAPFPKSIFELTANKTFYNHAPIDPYRVGDDFTDYSGESLVNYAIGQTGVGNDIYNLFEPAQRLDKSMAEYATGMVFGQESKVDQTKERRKRRYENQQRRINERAKRKRDARNKQREKGVI